MNQKIWSSRNQATRQQGNKATRIKTTWLSGLVFPATKSTQGDYSELRTTRIHIFTQNDARDLLKCVIPSTLLLLPTGNYVLLSPVSMQIRLYFCQNGLVPNRSTWFRGGQIRFWPPNAQHVPSHFSLGQQIRKFMLQSSAFESPLWTTCSKG